MTIHERAHTATQDDYLPPGTRVRRRRFPAREGEVRLKVGYLEPPAEQQVWLVWRYVRWNTGRATVVRTVDLEEVPARTTTNGT